MPTLLEGSAIKTDADRQLIDFMNEKFLPFALSLEKQGYTPKEISEGFMSCVMSWRVKNGN